MAKRKSSAPRVHANASAADQPAASPAAVPPRPPVRQGNRLLTACLAVSLGLHALLLTIHFTSPERPTSKSRDHGLEVVLVNARHQRAPDKPDVLAQANLDGGGSTDENVRPTTPLPPQDKVRDGETLVETRKRTQQQPVQPQPALTQTAKPAPARAEPKPADPAEAEPTPRPSGQDLLDSARAISQLEAQIERNLNEYAKRPRRQFVGARSREYRFAQYVEDWRQKIERVGTLNYPDAARGKMYGSLLLSVSIRADGSIEKVEIQRSSGEPVLDQAALRIVQLAAPFSPFPANIKADTDIIDIVRTWTFTNTDRLSTQ